VSGSNGKVRRIRIGARQSNLSMRQVEIVQSLLASAYPDLLIEIEPFSTSGDRQLDTPLPLIGGKGVFTEELEDALLAGRIDLAVHSLKDLPTLDRDGLTLAAIPERGPVHDVVISRTGKSLASLPVGAAIGTSSLRRSAQLRRIRSDFDVLSIRGNVETRIRKALAHDGPYDAIVLAAAGLERLGIAESITEILSIDAMFPAPGQGALAVQSRDVPDIHHLLAPIHHVPTAIATIAERSFLSGLGGGCSAPVSAFGRVESGTLYLDGRVSSVDGIEQIEVQSIVPRVTEELALDAGARLAQQALERGALLLMDGIR
jgi:hydroxymethylbilane synthase